MPASLRDIAWPEFFVVEYRDGRRERLRRSWEGVSFPIGDTVEKEPDFFIAWPLKQPRNGLASYGIGGIKNGRLCLLDDIERILDHAGTVLWSRSE